MRATKSLRAAASMHRRIIAIPLTRPTPAALARSTGPGQDPVKSLTFYHFQINTTEDQNDKGEGTSTSAEKGKGRTSWWPEQGALRWVQDKAAQAWTGFGSAEEGNWKRKVFQMGERAVDRIDFEELALKGVDPSLGPKLLHWSNEKEKAARERVQISLLFPPSIQTPEASIEHLKSLLVTRTPKHYRGFWLWFIIAPFTAPFMIVPVIPNLPFFFCAWRSWSHYRAYKASEYLSRLIDHGAIHPEPSPLLDTIYSTYQPKSLPQPSSDDTASQKPSRSNAPRILLSREAIPAIKTTFELGSQAETDMYRAFEQAGKRTEQLQKPGGR